MLITCEDWQLRLDSERRDPDIIDRYHRSPSLEIEVNAVAVRSKQDTGQAKQDTVCDQSRTPHFLLSRSGAEAQ